MFQKDQSKLQPINFSRLIRRFLKPRYPETIQMPVFTQVSPQGRKNVMYRSRGKQPLQGCHRFAKLKIPDFLSQKPHFSRFFNLDCERSEQNFLTISNDRMKVLCSGKFTRFNSGQFSSNSRLFSDRYANSRLFPDFPDFCLIPDISGRRGNPALA